MKIERTEEDEIKYFKVVKEMMRDYTQTSKVGISKNEAFFYLLQTEKQTLTPELKQVIDDMTLKELGELSEAENDKISDTIKRENLEVLQYLLLKGLKVTIFHTMNSTPLFRLLFKGITEKRKEILKVSLESVTKTQPISMKIEEWSTGFSYIKLDYMLILLNADVIEKEYFIEHWEHFSKTKKQKLADNSSFVREVAIELKDYSCLKEFDNIFLF